MRSFTKSIQIILLTILICNFSYTNTIFANGNTTTLLNENYYIEENLLNGYSIEQVVANENSAKQFELFSHGKSGVLWINNEWKNPPQIAEWLLENNYLQQHTQLNIYGCEFAKGERGRAAVAYLEKALGVCVAASDDITGINGDWDLEVGNSISSIKINDYPYNLQSCNLLDPNNVFENNNSDWVEDSSQNIAGDIYPYDQILSGDYPGTIISDGIGIWDGTTVMRWYYDPTNNSGNPNGDYFIGTQGFLCIVNTNNAFIQCGSNYQACLSVASIDDFGLLIESRNTDGSKTVLEQQSNIPATGNSYFTWEEFCYTIDANDIPPNSEAIIFSINAYTDAANNWVFADAYRIVPEEGSTCAEACPEPECINPTAPVISVTNNTCPSTTDGSFSATTACTTGSTLEWSTDSGTTWSTTVPTWADAVSAIARCVDDADATCFSPSSNEVTAVLQACCEQPMAPAIEVTNNTCPSTTDGSFSATTACAAGSTLEWSTDGGVTWSTTAPTWADGISAVARCVDDADNTCVSTSSNEVTAVLQACCTQPTAPVVEVTNNICPATTGTFGVTTNCSVGSTIEWSTDSGATWSTTAPTWADAVSAIARCVDDADATCFSPSSNEVTAVLQDCTAPSTYDVSLTKTVDQAQTTVGSNVVFTITVNNNGDAVTGATVTDVLPNGSVYVSDDSGGAYDSGTSVWTIGNMAAGGTATLNLTIQLTEAGSLTNTATVAINETETDTTNNEDTACVSVPVPLPCDGAGITITAEGGATTYQWYKDGVAISGATNSTYIATETGEYNYTINGGMLDGDCSDQMCCPIIIEDGDCPSCPPTRCLGVTITVN